MIERILGSSWIRDFFNPNHDELGRFASGGSNISRAPDTGAGMGGGQAKPSWAGEQHQRIDGLDVYNGHFGATKAKWAVGDARGEMASNWEDTPRQAVDDMQKRQVEREHNIKLDALRQEHIVKIKAGDQAAFRALAGSDTVSTSGAVGILRMLGYRDTDAKKVVGRLRMTGESRAGTIFYGTDELRDRYFATRDKYVKAAA